MRRGAVAAAQRCWWVDRPARTVSAALPASFGMFIDNVLELEFVDWDGEIHHCSPTERPDDFYSLLAGLGRHGVGTAAGGRHGWRGRSGLPRAAAATPTERV